MLRHNLLITYRSFLRNKSSFLINLIGLSTGLACVLLIYLWVHDEMSVDKFHEKDEQLYQVMQNFKLMEDGKIETWDRSPALLADALTEAIPEIEYAVSVNNKYYFQEEGIISHGDLQFKTKGILASKDYFNAFSYKLIHGNKDQVLADKNSVVISKELAIKLFNTTENILGKTIEWVQKRAQGTGEVLAGPFQISGIFEGTPSNSTKHFELLLSFELLTETVSGVEKWNTDAAETYLILRKGTDIRHFNEKIKDFLHTKDEFRKKGILFVQQYSSRYLHNHFENGVQAGGRITYVKIFTIIALFILIIACVNFMNLSTARASVRMKEVGVKKTTGASRESLVLQFLGESMILVFLSTLIALLFVNVILPHFNEITQKQLSLEFDPRFLLVMLGIVCCTGLLAGSYPAFYLSGFKPVEVLKGRLTTSLGEKWIRKGLVICQFSLSVVFVIGFLILNRQVEFILKKQLGYSKDNVITFVSRGESSEKVVLFMERLRNTPEVLDATNIWGGSFLNNSNSSTAPDWEGRPEGQELLVPRPHVGHGFFETLDIKLKTGRFFSEEYSNEESKIIINEAAVKLIGYENPVGRILTRGRNNPDRYEIIGVVKDFHIESLHERIKPTFIRFSPEGKNIMVKINANDTGETVKKLKAMYEEFHPGYPFEYSFLDEEYQSLYNSESRIAILSKYFCALAIIISCLGLFGLSLFTTERRKKEIGIRKVLGASEFGIIQMLTRDFTKIVLIAIAISLPISYLLSREWLANFAYTFELNMWLFLLPGFFVFLVAWITVGAQTLQAARLRPVHSLRDE